MTPAADDHTAHADAARSETPDGIVLFDGVCNLCNGAVQFIIDRDRANRFRFAALQTPIAAELLRARGHSVPAGAPDTILLIEGDRVFDRSTAALRIARGLQGAWKILYGFIIVPRPLRDVVYRFIARHRYRWFGQTESCRVPTPELRAKFLG